MLHPKKVTHMVPDKLPMSEGIPSCRRSCAVSPGDPRSLQHQADAQLKEGFEVVSQLLW